jgi:hypothetical protein
MEGDDLEWARLKWVESWAASSGKQRKGFRPGKRFLRLNSTKKVNGLQKLAFGLFQGYLEFQSKGSNVSKPNLN